MEYQQVKHGLYTLRKQIKKKKKGYEASELQTVSLGQGQVWHTGKSFATE